MSEALEKARRVQRERRENGEITVKHSLRSIINAKCKECIYDPVSGIGTWKQQTEACTSYDCPIYPVRPVSKPRKVKQ